MSEIEAFIRDAAQKRGIDPDVAVTVARSEGGVDVPAAHGDFDTGDSWWPFQLHYGGTGYEKYGYVAGMGNGFTALTGWQPGDPAAWRDSVRYALNRAKASGWTPWYGAAHVGVGQWDGIDRTHPWDASAETWDYEAGSISVPKIAFDPAYPAVLQDDDWSCAPTSLTWAFRAIGRTPATNWIEGDMLARGLVSRADGLLDHTGAGIVRWIEIDDAEHYGSDGYTANNQCPITWDQLVPEIDPHAPYPMLLGLPNWNLAGEGHWVGIRGFGGGRIQLANPDTGATFGQSSLSRSDFEARQGAGATIVRVLHPDLLEAPVPAPSLPPAPAVPTLAEVRAALAAMASVPDEQITGRYFRDQIVALLDKIPA